MNATDSTPVRNYCAIPSWIENGLTLSDLEAIAYGGCESGAYMPAVTYHTANAIMAEHGDNVLDWIQSRLGELPKVPDDTSWSGMAVHFLSCAVETWVQEAIAEICEDEPEAEAFFSRVR